MTETAATTKVVINAQHGGFDLSDDAVRAYLNRTGRDWSERPNERFPSLRTIWTVDGEDHWSAWDIPRADPVLVAVVEEMGEAANGKHAALMIVELPKGARYFIAEYDGIEAVRTVDDIPWETA